MAIDVKYSRWDGTCPKIISVSCELTRRCSHLHLMLDSPLTYVVYFIFGYGLISIGNQSLWSINCCFFEIVSSLVEV